MQYHLAYGIDCKTTLFAFHFDQPTVLSSVSPKIICLRCCQFELYTFFELLCIVWLSSPKFKFQPEFWLNAFCIFEFETIFHACSPCEFSQDSFDVMRSCTVCNFLLFLSIKSLCVFMCIFNLAAKDYDFPHF